MSAQNIISLGFNTEELSQDKQKVLEIMTDLFGKLEKYDGTTINPIKIGGLADLKKGIADATAAMTEFQKGVSNYNQTVTEQFQKQTQAKKSTDDLSLAEKEHQKNLQGTIQLQAKISEADTNAANDKAIEAQRLKAVTAEVNANAKAYLSQIGSINEARATIAQLTIERNKENATTEEGKARIAELNAEIDLNNEFIKSNSAQLEKQKINIGNYIGATSILAESLTNIDSKLGQMAAAGDITSEAFQKLTLEQKILQGLLDRQKEGFSSVTAELRTMRNTLDSLTVAGLENSESFTKLNTVYETAKQKVNELHTQQKILTSENPALTALTATARGLGGAYAFSAGASALLSDGNEKLDKELNKLVAIMTLLQGLEEAVRALKERGAIATALQAIATKALVAAKDLEVKIFGTSATVLKSETLAKTLNTDATELNTEAVIGNAEGAVINTEAMVATTVATEGAEAATISFRTALISTGIGALIIGIIYAITKLVGAISDWVKADEKAIEKEKALAEIARTNIDLQKGLNDAYEVGATKKLDLLEKQDALIKASGQNQFTQLAAERSIVQQRSQIAEDELKRYGVTIDKKAAKLKEFEDAEIYNKNLLVDLNNEIKKATEAGDKSEVESLQKKYAAGQKEIENVSKKYEIIKSLSKDFDDSQSKLEENNITQAKASAELLAKVSQEAADRRYKQGTDKNNNILADEKSTENERLEAIQSNNALEANLSREKEAELKRQLDANLITRTEYNSAVANLETDLRLKLIKAKEDQEKVEIEYADRRKAAFNTASKNRLESDAAVENALTKDVQKDLDIRLAALQQSISDKAKIIKLDYDEQERLAKEHGKTEEEIAAIESARQRALVELTASTQKDIYDIVTSYGERKLKAIDEQNKAEHAANDATQNFNQQTADLDQAFINRNISYGKYIRDKKKLDEQYSIDKARADVEDDEKSLQRIKDFELAELASKKRIATAELVNARASGNDQRIKEAQAGFDAITALQTKAADADVAATKKTADDKGKLNAAQVAKNLSAAQFLHEKENELAQASFNLAQKLVDAQYQNKINKIEETIQAQDAQTANEIAAVQRSTLSQRDQAAEIIILQESQKARDKVAKDQEKQEKRKEAVFDRDMAAAKALWSTVDAELGALATYGGTPYAFAIYAAIAALGAIEIASIFATPIPAYAEGVGIPGKGDHPGGLALTGEKFKPELIKEPGKKPYIVDRPTLLDLPVNSAVVPMEQMVNDITYAGMRQSFASTASSKDNTAWDIARWQAAQTKRALSSNNKKLVANIHIHNESMDKDYYNKKIIGIG